MEGWPCHSSQPKSRALPGPMLVELKSSTNCSLGTCAHIALATLLDTLLACWCNEPSSSSSQWTGHCNDCGLAGGEWNLTTSRFGGLHPMGKAHKVQNDGRIAAARLQAFLDRSAWLVNAMIATTCLWLKAGRGTGRKNMSMCQDPPHQQPQLQAHPLQLLGQVQQHLKPWCNTCLTT